MGLRGVGGWWLRGMGGGVEKVGGRMMGGDEMR